MIATVLAVGLAAKLVLWPCLILLALFSCWLTCRAWHALFGRGDFGGFLLFHWCGQALWDVVVALWSALTSSGE
jgi:hypothetical protein